MSNEPKWGERKPQWLECKPHNRLRGEHGKRPNQWRKIDSGPRPKSIYVVPMYLTIMLTEHLGAVQERADGRWNWWRYKAHFFKWQTGQGVSPNEEQAMAKVLEGWD